MSTQVLTVRLMGTLPPLAELLRALAVAPTYYETHCTPLPPKSSEAQYVDLWLLHLAKWEGATADETLFAQVTKTLSTLAPAFAALPKEGFRADLVLWITQLDDWGECSLPPELLAACASAQLTLSVAVLASAPLQGEEPDATDGDNDDEDPDEDKEDE